jgi:hypothetical protein
MGAASDRVGLQAPIFVGAIIVLVVWLWARFRRNRMMDSLDRQEPSPRERGS